MKAGETLKSRGVPMKNKTKRKNRIFRVLLATMLILFGVSFRNDGKIGISGVQSVQAATKNVVVRFRQFLQLPDTKILAGPLRKTIPKRYMPRGKKYV